LSLFAKALGAKGDGATKDTVVLQNVIDSLPASGGTVYLHEGTFIAGTLRLKSNLTLFIDSTATLKGSPDVVDFPAQTPPTNNVNLLECRRALLYAEGASNVTIDGGGTIDGNGSLSQYAVNSDGTEVNRPIMFWPVQTSNVMVRNVYFHDGVVGASCRRSARTSRSTMFTSTRRRSETVMGSMSWTART
jgi:hypothetical protein